MGELRHVFEVHIQASQVQVWEAFTKSEMLRQWAHNLSVETDWQPGSPVLYKLPDGTVATEGTIVEFDPPRRFVARLKQVYTPELAADPYYKLTWEVEPLGSACKVTVTSEDFPSEDANYNLLKGGSRAQLDALKTFVETGKPLVVG